MSRVISIAAAIVVLGGCGGVEPAPAQRTLPAQMDRLDIMAGYRVMPLEPMPGYNVLPLRTDPLDVVPSDRLRPYPASVDVSVGGGVRSAAAMRATPRQLLICEGEARIGDGFTLTEFSLAFRITPYARTGSVLRAGPLQVFLADGFVVVQIGDAILASRSRLLVRNFTYPSIALWRHHVLVTRCGRMIALHVDGVPAGTLYSEMPPVVADYVQLGSVADGLCGALDDVELRSDAPHLDQFTPAQQIVVQKTHLLAFDFDGTAADRAARRELTLYANAALVAE